MVWVSAGFVIGCILGSFIKALADRSLKKQSFWGRSYCEECKHKLSWYDLLPVVSFLLLKGKCRYCGDKVNVEYLLVEVVMGVLIGFLFFQNFKNFQSFDSLHSLRIFDFQFSIFALDLIYKIFFISILVALFLTDLKKMLIPDRISIPAIWISLVFLVGMTIYNVGYLYYYLNQSTIGRLLLPPHSDYFQRHALTTAEPLFYGILMGLIIAGFFMGLILITKGKGMGGGDVKLGGLMGLALGFPQGLIALMLAFLLGALYGLPSLLLGKKKLGQPIPFGPFLVLGSLVSLFWGNQILNWYLHLSI